MKKFLKFLLVAGIVAVCIVTCPEKEAHKDALKSVINSALDDEIGKVSDNEGINKVGSAISSFVVEIALDSKLEVKNYFVCSLGQFDTDEGVRTVSLGLLGHVFTMSEEQFKKAIRE